MLTIYVPPREGYNSKTDEFYEFPGQKLQLEHSLVSMSKWESKWGISFLDRNTPKTQEQQKDYIRCMTITQNVNPLTYNFLTAENIKAINEYIDHPMTATKFFGDNGKGPGGRKGKITAEQIYYWMIAFQIPFECQKWHLNRLLTLIRVCSIESGQANGKKMSKSEIMKRNAALNAQRKARLGTRG